MAGVRPEVGLLHVTWALQGLRCHDFGAYVYIPWSYMEPGGDLHRFGKLEKAAPCFSNRVPYTLMGLMDLLSFSIDAQLKGSLKVSSQLLRRFRPCDIVRGTLALKFVVNVECCPSRFSAEVQTSATHMCICLAPELAKCADPITERLQTRPETKNSSWHRTPWPEAPNNPVF